MSDWSSDVCSSDLHAACTGGAGSSTSTALSAGSAELSSAATRIGTRSPTVGVFLPPPLKIPQPASASSAIPTAGAFINLIIALPCPRSGRPHPPLECPTSEPHVDGSIRGRARWRRSARTDHPRDRAGPGEDRRARPFRSEEHTSELQSLMRISYAVFCLKKKRKQKHQT